MGREIEFSSQRTSEKRIHCVDQEDVRIVLSRLPSEVRTRLRGVRFNNLSRGVRRLGYVNRGRREIALCALPRYVSLTRFLLRGQSPRQFGATRGRQWPAVAVRRFMLYDVFLHELGHLQIIDGDAGSVRRKFAMETKAQQFAMYWCKKLWSERFDHADPAHNAPTEQEFADADPEFTDVMLRIQQRPDDVELLQRLDHLCRRRGKTNEAKEALEKAVALAPRNPWTNLYLGNWYFGRDIYSGAVKYFARAIKFLPDRAVAYWCLAEAYGADGELSLADKYFQLAVEVEPSDKLAKNKLKTWQAFYLPIKNG